MDRSITFERLEFSHIKASKGKYKEYYNLVSDYHCLSIGLVFKKRFWHYTQDPPTFRSNVYDLGLSELRKNLIEDVKKVKTTYHITAYKNLNIIRDKFHPDLIHQIAIMINDLRHVHYLETAEI